MSILVSINCITYNHEKYISDAIAGFLKQKTNFEYEIVIGEDCSTDSTRKIIEKYAERYPEKIRLITSDNNVGMMKNERRIYEASRGKYIAECEGDDFWIDSNKLQKQIDYMENHPECTFCFHNAYRVNRYGEVIQPMIPTDIKERDYSCGEMITLGFIPTASRIYRKEAMLKIPEWYENAIVGDYPSQLIITDQGYAHYFKDIMSAYRMGVKNSATEMLFGKKNAKAKLIRNQKDLLSLLDNFNEYSDFKFADEVKERKKVHEYQIYLIEGNLKKIKSPKYREYYNQLGMRDKAAMYIVKYTPHLYIIVFNIYNVLKVFLEKLKYKIDEIFRTRRII